MNNEVIEAYIFFCKSSYFLSFLFKKGFQHVECILKVGNPKFFNFLYVGYKYKKLKILVIYRDTFEKILNDCKFTEICKINHKSLIEINKKIKRNKISDMFGIQTCVSIVKSILGIRNFFIITPYQLFKYLRGKKWTEADKVQQKMLKNWRNNKRPN